MTNYSEVQQQPEITIERGIPIPPRMTRKGERKSIAARNAIKRMRIGDSFVLNGAKIGTSMSRAYQYAKQARCTVAVRKAGNDAVRIWKTGNL